MEKDTQVRWQQKDDDGAAGGGFEPGIHTAHQTPIHGRNLAINVVLRGFKPFIDFIVDMHASRCYKLIL